MEEARSQSSKVILGDHDGRLTKGAHPDLVKYLYVDQIESQKEIFQNVSINE